MIFNFFYNEGLICVVVISILRVHKNGNDQSVQTQYFSENKDQNHTYEQSRLLGSATNSSITYDADGETSG